ncbi:MAG: hypothetical protein WCH78_08515 [Bacteroidota bacterium]
MKRVFLLRAYGDFLVAIQSLLNSPVSCEFEIIASRHHLPLFEAIKDSIDTSTINIRFEDFKIQQSQLRLFTNRHLLHLDTIKELSALKKFLHANATAGSQNYIDQKIRKQLLELITGEHFESIRTEGFMYDAFHRFFKTEKVEILNRVHANRRILILPSARLSKRDLPETLINTIQQKHSKENDSVQVAYFKNTKRADALTYQSFAELVRLISAADFIYGADSLPIHLSYLLKKPHYILYPEHGSNLFFTPYAIENHYFSAFNSFE